MTLSSQEKPLFLKNSCLTLFLLCSYFRVHPTTLLLNFLKYWGTDAWAVPPPQIFRGPSPQSPLGLRHCWKTTYLASSAVASKLEEGNFVSFAARTNRSWIHWKLWSRLSTSTTMCPGQFRSLQRTTGFNRRSR